MESPTERRAAPVAIGAATSEPRQRWRLTFARAAVLDGQTPAGREYVVLWETALAESGLPLATTDAGRPRFAIGAPLPFRTAGRAELADLWLTERRVAWRVREALDRALPSGHELVRIDNVWLGAPALPGRVAAADYLVTLGGRVDAVAVAAGAIRLLAADRLVRARAKGGGAKTYDLRPLIISIETGVQTGVTGSAAADGDARVVVRTRTRIHPELGSGRPAEVIAALADELGVQLESAETIRERLVLADDLEP